MVLIDRAHSHKSGIVFVLVAVGLLSVPFPLPVTSAQALPASSAAVVLESPPSVDNSSCNNTTTSYPIVLDNLTLSTTPINLSSEFWGTTVSPRAPLLPNEGELVNATPTQLIVWPGAFGGDLYNPISNTIYSSGGSSEGAPSTNESQFITWCKSIGCHAIFQVPGEVNNTTLAASIVTMTEVEFQFRPTYWEIGNEPSLWKHFDQNWSDWSTLPVNEPTPDNYADEVRNYTAAMQAANSAAGYGDSPLQIIGLPAAARSPAPNDLWHWIEKVVAIDGPIISAVAFHEYPAAGTLNGKSATIPSLQGFYGSLTDPVAGLPARIANLTDAVDHGISTYCDSDCTPIPILVTEVGTALSHKPFGRTYSANFPGALAMSAQFIQAMSLDIPNIDVFGAVFNTNNSWLNLSGSPRPEYTAFSQVLNHLGSVAFALSDPTNSTTLNSSIFAISTVATNDQNRTDLLVVNTNATDAISYEPTLPNYTPGAPVEVWSWNGQLVQETYHWLGPKKVFETANITTANAVTPAPVALFCRTGLPADWVLPPQSLVLFETYNAPAAPVQFTETGIPSGVTWFLKSGDGPGTTATNTSNVTVFAPLGKIRAQALTTYLPVLANATRYVADPIEPFVLSANGTDVAIRYVQQWRLSISSSPEDGGGVVSGPTWANASEPVALSATPEFGYAVSNWVTSQHLGDGDIVNKLANVTYVQNGTAFSNTTLVTTWTTITNVTGPTVSKKLVPIGAVSERVVFNRSFPVVFTESGLAPGTNWSVNITAWSTDSQRTTNYSVIEHWGTVGGNVTLIRNVTSQSSKPNSSTVILNTTMSSVTPSLSISEANGSYLLTVNPVVGYRSQPYKIKFTVEGNRQSIAVNFTPIYTPSAYPVDFAESGLPSGTEWFVTVSRFFDPATSTVLYNYTVSSAKASLVVRELPGPYGYVVRTTDLGFQAHPAAYGFNVTGPGLVVPVLFTPVRYDVVWQESGLGNQSWSVSVSGLPILSSGAWATDTLSNGSYSYTVPNVRDYLPSPRSGTVVVNGSGQVINITFARMVYNVTFQPAGLTPGATWCVQLSNGSCREVETFATPNGSYFYNVTPPAGFVAVPSHGILVVNGTGIVVLISFTATEPAPIPPIWDLVFPALLVAAVTALAGYGTYVLVGARKRRRSGAKR